MTVRDGENVPAGSAERGTSGEEYHEIETRCYVYYTRRQDKGGKDGSRRRQGVISPVSYGLTWETHLTGTQVLSYMQRHSRRGITLQRARANDRRGIRLEERE